MCDLFLIKTISSLTEKDYPPVARAGKDIVLQLPHNSAVLYGNASTDDKVNYQQPLRIPDVQ